MAKSSDNLAEIPGESAPKVVKSKKEIRRPLKPRDIKFVQAKVSGQPNYKAAMAVTGATDMNVASTQAVRMLQNVTLREAIDEAMAAEGFTMEKIMKPVQEALDYTDVEGDKRTETEMHLKGHDRAVRLLQIAGGDDRGAGNTININLGTQNYLKK